MGLARAGHGVALFAEAPVMPPCSGHRSKFGALMGFELARTIATGRPQHARWAAGLEADTPT